MPRLPFTGSVILVAGLLLSTTGMAEEAHDATDHEEPDMVTVRSPLGETARGLDEFATVKVDLSQYSVHHHLPAHVHFVDTQGRVTATFTMHEPVAYIRMPEGNYLMMITSNKKQEALPVHSSYDALRVYDL